MNLNADPDLAIYLKNEDPDSGFYITKSTFRFFTFFKILVYSI